MALEKGTQAPDFTLKSKSEEGLKDIKLSDNYGNKQTVLLFFPLAFTGVCTDEMCSVTEGLDAYAGVNSEVYGISVDSPFAQEGWAKANNINVTLLSDFNKETAAAYDVIYEELLGFKGVAKRSAFVVDKEGVIQYSWSTDDPKVLPPFNEIKSALS